MNSVVSMLTANRDAFLLKEGRHLKTSLDVTMATQRRLIPSDKMTNGNHLSESQCFSYLLLNYTVMLSRCYNSFNGDYYASHIILHLDSLAKI